MPRIILARHGQTEFNQTGFMMGRSDSALTALGTATVRQMARTFEHEAVSEILCSPLGRAVATARIYGEILGIEPEIRPALAELSCGEWEGKPRALVSGGEGRMRKTWRDNVPGGESYQDAEHRVAPLISQLRLDHRPGTIMVVGHAGGNRVFLKLWLEVAPGLAVRIACPHDLVYILEEDSTVKARWSTGQESQGLSFEQD